MGENFSQIFSNFLKFSQIFSKGGGVPDRGGLSDTFLVLVFLWGIFFSQIFSNFLKFSRNTFLCIGILGKFSQIFSNFLKFSQIFSNFLKISQKFQLILNKIFVPNDVGWGADWVGGSRLGSGMPDTVLVFDYFLGKLSHLFQSSALWG